MINHKPVKDIGVKPEVDLSEDSDEKKINPRKREKKVKISTSSTNGLSFLFEVTDNKAKAMLVREKNSSVEILSVDTFPDEDYRNAHLEMDWPAFSAWLKKIGQEKADGKKFDSRVMLVGHGVYADVIARPDVAVKEMKDHVAWQVAENIPFTLDDSLLQHELTDDSVVAATVDPEFRSKVLSSFHEADIYPLSVSLLPFSYQAVVKKHKGLNQKTFLLVHISRHHTYLIHFYQGKFNSIRELSIGGEHVTQAMIGTLVLGEQSINIGYKEAQILKESLGIPTKNLEAVPEEPKNSQLSMRIRPIFDRLVADIKFSMKQFQSDFPAVEIEKVLFSGGGAQMKGIESFMTERLDYVAESFIADDICPTVKLSEIHLLGMLFLPLKRFNFAGPEDVLKPRFEKYVFFLKKGVCVLIVVMLLLVIVAWGKKMISQVRLKNLKQNYSLLGATDEKMAELDDVIFKIGKLSAARRSKIQEEPSLGKALKELSLLVPRVINFQSVRFLKEPEPAMVISGTIQAGRQSPDIVLSGFIESIEGSLYFEQTKLESRSANEKNAEQIDFIINAKLVSS